MVTAQEKASPLAHPQVSQLMWGFIPTQAVHVAAKLAVFDLLRDGPDTPRDLAKACGCQEAPLLRALRFLTAVGLLTENEQGAFSSTAQGDLLRSDHPQSLRALALWSWIRWSSVPMSRIWRNGWI